MSANNCTVGHNNYRLSAHDFVVQYFLFYISFLLKQLLQKI